MSNSSCKSPKARQSNWLHFTSFRHKGPDLQDWKFLLPKPSRARLKSWGVSVLLGGFPKYTGLKKKIFETTKQCCISCTWLMLFAFFVSPEFWRKKSWTDLETPPSSRACHLQGASISLFCSIENRALCTRCKHSSITYHWYHHSRLWSRCFVTKQILKLMHP